MASYSMGEIAKMQADAARRVKEMGRRSRQLTSSGGSVGTLPNNPEPPVKERSAPTAVPDNSPHSGAAAGGLLGGLSNILSGLPFDLSSDRILIFLLIYLLGGEKCDKLLLLALIYLAI